MRNHRRPDAQKLRQSKNVPGTEKRQSSRHCRRATENSPHICYSPTKSGERQRTSRYRQIALEQTINLKSAVDFAKSIGLPLVAHCIIHWVGTAAGDDADGELFAEVRETFSRWLRYRGVPFAAIWVREKKAGGMAEVEHAHLVFHVPEA
jgi:hypothetical protein